MSQPLPTLKTIEGALDRMQRQAPPLAVKASWVWPWGYETRRRGGSDGGGAGEVSRPTEGAVGYDRWSDADGVHAASREWTIRTEKARAGRLIMQAGVLLEAADGALDKATKAAGKGDQLPAAAEEQRPRTATKAEVNKAAQMKRWRDAERAKGVGRGTY